MANEFGGAEGGNVFLGATGPGGRREGAGLSDDGTAIYAVVMDFRVCDLYSGSGPFGV